MLKKILKISTLALGTLLSLSFTASAGDSGLQEGASAATLAAPCAGCHGPNGVSKGPAPSIAGLSERYIRNVMKSFRKGKGGSTIMNRIAKGYSKAETKLLAKHFGGMKFVRAEQKFDPALAAKGAAIHKANCEKCHKKNGSNPKNNKGILAGQWSPYLAWQMHNFLNGTRNNRTMKKQLEKAGGADVIPALVAYYASVK